MSEHFSNSLTCELTFQSDKLIWLCILTLRQTMRCYSLMLCHVNGYENITIESDVIMSKIHLGRRMNTNRVHLKDNL